MANFEQIVWYCGVMAMVIIAGESVVRIVMAVVRTVSFRKALKQDAGYAKLQERERARVETRRTFVRKNPAAQSLSPEIEAYCKGVGADTELMLVLQCGIGGDSKHWKVNGTPAQVVQWSKTEMQELMTLYTVKSVSITGAE